MNNQPPDINYILIAGLPRSGSTLLQSVLNKSPETFTFPESHFFEEANKINSTSVFSEKQVIKLLEQLKRKWQLNTVDLIDELKMTNDNNIDIRSLFFKLIDQFNPQPSQSSLIGIEKTPGNLISIESLLTYRRDLKVLLSYRNPRDFANSMCQQHWAPDSLVKVTKMWNRSMQTINQLGNQFPDRVRLVSYEDMIAQPENTFSKIYGFVGIIWRSEFLQDLNTNAAQYITSAETDWKKNNLQLNLIDSSKVKLILNHRQRLTVHFNNIPTAIRLGLLRHYKF